MNNYYNNLSELEKKEQLAKCRFMKEMEFLRWCKCFTL